MILPEKYQGIDEEELKGRIAKVKKKFGNELVILAHHYQRDEIYSFADFTGDSFKLAAEAAKQKKAKYVVFCGVHFMAEAARILCDKNQRVFLPDMDAGCPMAEMANVGDVESAWEAISKATDNSRVIPVTYMNSAAVIKAFCGSHGGIVCTSSNAGKVFDWALRHGDKILFLPDEHLGRNTARAKGIKEVLLWKRDENNGGLTTDEIRKSKVIVWDGFCHVHTFFVLDHIKEARKKYLSGMIIVHPECTEDVVEASDEAGSTEQIKKYVEAAKPGTTVIVGTEINMVHRLASNNKDKVVVPLARSLCPNMFRISLNDLCWTLEELGKVNEVFVDDAVTRDAKLALQRMLDNR